MFRNDLNRRLLELGKCRVAVEGDGRCAFYAPYAFLKYELGIEESFILRLRSMLDYIYVYPEEHSYPFFDHIDYDDAMAQFDRIVANGVYDCEISDLVLPLVSFSYEVNVISLWQTEEGLDEKRHSPLPLHAVSSLFRNVVC